MKKIGLLALCFFILSFVIFHFYQKPIEVFEHQEIIDLIHQKGIHSVFKQADIHKYNQDYPKAILDFEKTLTLDLQLAERQYALNQLAFISLTMNKDSMAHYWIGQLENLKYPLSISDSADYFYNVGTWAYHTFKPKTAEAYLQKALVTCKGVYGEQHLKVGLCLTQLGAMYYEFADIPDSSFKYVPLAHKVFQNNLMLKPYSVECELAMAMTESSKRNYDGVIAHCEIAIEITKKNPFFDVILASRAMCMKGNALRKNSSFESDKEKKGTLRKQAESLYLAAIETSKGLGHIRIEEFYRDLILSKLRDSAQFYHYLNELKEILKSLPDIHAKPERLEGLYFDFKGNSVAAIYHYEKALKSYETIPFRNRAYVTETYNRLGELYTTDKKFDLAMHYILTSMVYGTEYENNKYTLKELMNPKFYQATPLLFFDFGIVANTLLKQYESNNETKTLVESFKAFKLTDELLFPGLLSSDENSILVYQEEVAKEVYCGATECAYLLYKKTGDNYYLNQAFKFIERPKSFLLFKNADIRSNEAKPKQTILDEIKNTNFTISKLKWENNNPQKTTFYQQKLDSLNYILEQEYPIFHKFKVTQPVQNIKKIQNRLGINGVLIEIKFTADKLFIFFCDSKRSELFVESIDSNFINQTVAFKSILLNIDPSIESVNKYNTLATQIYLKIFGKIPPQYFHQKELYIISDGILNDIPFEALVKPTTEKAKSYKDLPYLLHDCVISYAPSWKILDQNIDFRLSKNPHVVTYQYAANTNELPYSKNEITTINNTWKNVTNRVVDELQDPKSTFMQDLNSFEVLHLSLHASGSSNDKLENKIYLKAKFLQPLYGFELMDKDVKIPFVVLSACETAKGKTESGEGVFSLSRIFLQSGTKYLVSTLWKVDDATTTQLISQMYYNAPHSLDSNSAKLRCNC